MSLGRLTNHLAARGEVPCKIGSITTSYFFTFLKSQKIFMRLKEKLLYVESVFSKRAISYLVLTDLSFFCFL